MKRLFQAESGSRGGQSPTGACCDPRAILGKTRKLDTQRFGVLKGNPMLATFRRYWMTFREYPFPPASVYPRGRVAYAAIRDVDPSAAPPELRTHDGETLFISGQQSDEFRATIARAKLTIVRRVDVWDLLLEPFLDTQFDREHERRTIATLTSLGVSRNEALRIRASVRRPMLAYNALMWDWVHLGLCDLLYALRDSMSRTDYTSFYRDAMELADRGRIGRMETPIEPAHSRGVGGQAE
jgi:hypothetical protein